MLGAGTELLFRKLKQVGGPEGVREKRVEVPAEGTWNIKGWSFRGAH